MEGAFIQGLGYLTSEEVVYDKETGHLITDGTWKYKPPSAACIPQQMFVEFLKARFLAQRMAASWIRQTANWPDLKMR